MPEANQTNPKESRDGLALILGGIFILGLVFATYTYFNKSSEVQNTELSSEETSILDKLKNIISSNTVREEGEEEEKGDEIAQGEKKETSEEGQVQDEEEISKPEGKNGSLLNLGTGGPTNGTENKEETAFSELAWIPNDYTKGDISGSSYKVKSGDTLWEISDGIYGSGFEWTKILEANKDSVGFLPNCSQALIVPGQVLSLPAP